MLVTRISASPISRASSSGEVTTAQASSGKSRASPMIASSLRNGYRTAFIDRLLPPEPFLMPDRLAFVAAGD